MLTKDVWWLRSRAQQFTFRATCLFSKSTSLDWFEQEVATGRANVIISEILLEIQKNRKKTENKTILMIFSPKNKFPINHFTKNQKGGAQKWLRSHVGLKLIKKKMLVSKDHFWKLMVPSGNIHWKFYKS